MWVYRIASVLVVLAGLAHLGFLYKETMDAAGMLNRLVGIDVGALNAAEGFAGYGDGVLRVLWNQGVYNGFLGVGLLLSFLQAPKAAWQTRLYLALCIMVAGIFGGITVAPLVYAQAVLGAVTALAVYFAAPDAGEDA